MTPKLESSVVLAKDLKEQPESSHILLVGAGRPNYYAVDYMTEDESTVHFYRNGTRGATLVYSCRKVEGAWAMVLREAVRVVTEKELSQRQHEDQKAMESFFSELDPEAWKEAQEMAKHGHSHGMSLEDLMSGSPRAQAPGKTRDDGKPVPGQYL